VDIKLRTVVKDLHELTVTIDSTTAVETCYDIHLIDLKENLEGILEDITFALSK